MKIAVHTLNAFSDQELIRAYGMMSDSKKERVARLRHSDDKRRSIIGDYVARCLISEKLGILPEMVEIRENSAGKPYVNYQFCNFSISHSEQMIVCAVSEHPIGIDVERIQPISISVVKYICSDEEWKYVVADNSDRLDNEGLRRFYEVWTSKEALIKVRGTGLEQVKTIDFFAMPEKKMSFEVDDYVISARWD